MPIDDYSLAQSDTFSGNDDFHTIEDADNHDPISSWEAEWIDIGGEG